MENLYIYQLIRYFMNKFTQEQIGKAKVNPIFKGLSDELKDPKNFKKVEKKIANVMVSDHKHSTIKAFTNCIRCQNKLTKKRETIYKLGFKDINQYQNWKKIMGYIINKKELVLYEKN